MLRTPLSRLPRLPRTFPGRSQAHPAPDLVRLVRLVCSCFVSGHDFSRAAKARANEGFSPWALSSAGADKHFLQEAP
jgi:hypothetical protein